MHRTIIVGAIEILGMQTLGGAGRVHHHIPSAAAHLCLQSVQLFGQTCLAGEVEAGKADALILQISLAAALSHACPHLMTLAQTFLHYITPYEATGSGYQYVHSLISFLFRA